MKSNKAAVLGPIIFNVYLAAVTLVSRHKLETNEGIPINYRLDENVFSSAGFAPRPSLAPPHCSTSNMQTMPLFLPRHWNAGFPG